MELTGKKLSGDHYYRVKVDAPMSEEVPAYTAECGDIIEALGMTFNEGEAFKAIWRMAAARQGRGKPGNKAMYDADKAAHYASRIAAQTKLQLEQQVAKDFAFPTDAPAPEVQKPRRVRVKSNLGQIALLDGQTADAFLLAVNRKRAEKDLVFEKAIIVEWCYEDETAWRTV